MMLKVTRRSLKIWKMTCPWSFTLLSSLSTTLPLEANHYDVLGLTPKANQSDIKTAYYELSKVYHPDKSKDEASLKKFRQISEAYEVLGNVKSKKMYDLGLRADRVGAPHTPYEPEPEPTDPTVRFYRSRMFRHNVPTMDGRTPVYDFDTWSKEHYGGLLKKQTYRKEQLKKKRDKQMDTLKANQQEAFIYIIVSLSALVLFVASSLDKDYDVDLTKKKK